MIERRDFLRFAGGAACGFAISPVPWQLLHDTAEWSQNWSWIPKTPRGPVAVKYSVCTLCPAGCSVKARCTGGRAVGLQGKLCPSGQVAHTAAYNARRLSGDGRTMYPAIARAIAPRRRVAVLDLGPERAMSALYRRFAAAFDNAVYLRPSDRAEATLNALAPMLGRAPGSLGIDLEHTKTLVSFGAPVLERWPAAMKRWRSGYLSIIQIEPRQSRTALAARTWIPTFDLELPSDLRVETPAVAIGSGLDAAREPSVAALNLQFGLGGIVPRAPVPWGTESAKDLTAEPDQSIDVLFLDSSRAFDGTSWPLIARKLRDGAVVVGLSYREDRYTVHAHYKLPVPAPFEALEDVGTPPCSDRPSFALASALIEANRPDALDHLNGILVAAGRPALGITVDDERNRRIAAIHRARSGALVAPDGSTTEIARLETPAALREKLEAGARWVGPASAEKLKSNGERTAGWAPKIATDSQRPFILLATAPMDDASPLMTKLSQESALFPPATIARMHPETAAATHVQNNTAVLIETVHGASTRVLVLDRAVMPGVIEAVHDIEEWAIAANVRSA